MSDTESYTSSESDNEVTPSSESDNEVAPSKSSKMKKFMLMASMFLGMDRGRRNRAVALKMISDEKWLEKRSILQKIFDQMPPQDREDMNDYTYKEFEKLWDYLAEKMPEIELGLKQRPKKPPPPPPKPQQLLQPPNRPPPVPPSSPSPDKPDPFGRGDSLDPDLGEPMKEEEPELEKEPEPEDDQEGTVQERLTKDAEDLERGDFKNLAEYLKVPIATKSIRLMMNAWRSYVVELDKNTTTEKKEEYIRGHTHIFMNALRESNELKNISEFPKLKKAVNRLLESRINRHLQKKDKLPLLPLNEKTPEPTATDTGRRK